MTKYSIKFVDIVKCICYCYSTRAPSSKAEDRDSVDGTATRCGLKGSGIEPWWVKRFSLLLTHPNQHWSPHSLPFNGCWGSFRVIKRSGCGADRPPAFCVELKKSKSIYLFHLHDPYRSLWDDLYLYHKVGFLLILQFVYQSLRLQSVPRARHKDIYGKEMYSCNYS